MRQNEGRRLEFKKQLPAGNELAKTIVAFANDAGGDILIGVNDDKSLVGLAEDELPRIEEQLCSMIYDNCYPAILPEITFVTHEGVHMLRVHIYRGSMPPYYLRKLGRSEGTYVRVGSTNRRADVELIAELERSRRRVAYDSEILPDKPANELSLQSFSRIFKEKTGEELTAQTLRKMELVREEQGVEYPTRALVLLSDDEMRTQYFSNARIECARFKGTSAEVFIDRKTIDSPLAQQAEEAYEFVLRHINESAEVQGVYTVTRWQYPIKAIREVIRNAVVHRQYSREGMNVKVAIYDDMVEITSPGLLPPSIDYSAMTSRQSDARNKTLAGVFKKLGIIDQWGNGLTLIAEELKQYPNVRLVWQEVGMFFQVQFVLVEHVSDVANPLSEREEEVSDIQKIMQTEAWGELDELSKEILQLVAEHKALNKQTLMQMTNKNGRTISKRLNLLLECKLLDVAGDLNSPARTYSLR